MKKIVLLILIMLQLHITSVFAVEPQKDNKIKTAKISENIEVNGFDFGALTDYLEINVVGFNKENCLLKRIYKYGANDMTLYYGCLRYGCDAQMGVSIIVKEGKAYEYFSNIDVINNITEPFGASLVNTESFEKELIPKIKEYALKDCTPILSDRRAYPLEISCGKCIDENNRIYIDVDIVYEILERDELRGEGVKVSENYKYYLDEHKEDMLSLWEQITDVKIQ